MLEGVEGTDMLFLWDRPAMTRPTVLVNGVENKALNWSSRLSQPNQRLGFGGLWWMFWGLLVLADDP